MSGMSIGDVMVRENYRVTKIVNVTLPGSMPSQYVTKGWGGRIQESDSKTVSTVRLSLSRRDPFGIEA